MPLKKDLGNALWLLLHTTAQIANDQPDSETKNKLIEHYREMEANLIPLLPCPQCQGHYNEHIATPEYQNQPDPKHLNQINYVHNQVNKLFNRPVFNLDQSMEFINKTNQGNIHFLKRQYLKSVLTIVHYWNLHFWCRPKKRFKRNIRNLRAFLNHSLKLLSLAEPEELEAYWNETDKPFQKPQLYQYFQTLDLPTDKVPENFFFDFKGCGCLNK